MQPRAGGYVQRTYGHAPQDLIARGAPIVDLLIPEWGGAHNEFLAVAATGDEALIRAARERLRLLGMPDSIISLVARSGMPHTTITVSAPQSGAITSLGVRCSITAPPEMTDIDILSVVEAKITGVNPARAIVTMEATRVVSPFKRVGEWA